MAIVLMIISVPSFAASFDDDGVLRLVNREEKITKNYDPDDLVKPDVPVNKKNQEDQVYLSAFPYPAHQERYISCNRYGIQGRHHGRGGRPAA